eukprot:CAMPEP_0170563212 /NCGR_PEP_ID=MMETSP0211-20121228/65088_1 /TAXON_ID=311385 /ORGANISM="Pseudokeronopsis sp., Strain OXSARD2" /LENGTH=96 /DNA_ID=CAMNT_0010881145 /DNA_START=324 /DNA_END=614 /DNA_ORIENTATION=-
MKEGEVDDSDNDVHDEAELKERMVPGHQQGLLLQVNLVGTPIAQVDRQDSSLNGPQSQEEHQHEKAVEKHFQPNLQNIEQNQEFPHSLGITKPLFR